RLPPQIAGDSRTPRNAVSRCGSAIVPAPQPRRRSLRDRDRPHLAKRTTGRVPSVDANAAGTVVTKAQPEPLRSSRGIRNVEEALMSESIALGENRGGPGEECSVLGGQIGLWRQRSRDATVVS